MKSKNTQDVYIPIVKIKQFRDSKARYNSRLSNPESIVDMIYPIIGDSDREMLIIVGVDSKTVPNVINITSIGTLGYAPAVPREIFKPLILSNCFGFFCIHNHISSGEINPSECDKKITNILSDGGKLLEIYLLDSLIIGHDKTFLSFRNAHLLNERITV